MSEGADGPRRDRLECWGRGHCCEVQCVVWSAEHAAEPREGADRWPEAGLAKMLGAVTTVRCVCGPLSRVRGQMARGGTWFGADRSFAKFVSKFAMLCIFPLREISCEISYAVHFP